MRSSKQKLDIVFVPRRPHATDQELIDDLRRVAALLGQRTLSKRAYERHGRFKCEPIFRRFGSWNRAMKKAGLEPSTFAPPATETALLENLYQLWRHCGRQPKIIDLVPPHSVFKI
jgi:hypothetical protein